MEQSSYREKPTDLDIREDNGESRRIPFGKETIDFATKLIRRKIPQAGHLMTPRHLWIQSVPTVQCDVVIMFPNDTPHDVLSWLQSRLDGHGEIGLNVNVRCHTSNDGYQFHLTAPFNLLKKCAEEFHLPKRLNTEYGAGLKEFIQSESMKFEGIENKENFFTSQERQWLILRLLESLRAKNGDQIGNLKLVQGQPVVPKLLSEGLIGQIFPLHEVLALKHLRTSWVRAFFNRQPINDICNYFGVKIAMYFAWLGHYTTALTVPAFIGFLFWIGFIRGNQNVEDVGFVLFSFFNVIWFTIYLEAWKRYSAELAYKWGTLDQRDQLLVEPRPLFTGKLEKSVVTGRLEPTYPNWKRNVFKYFVSLPVIVICLIIVFAIMVASFELQDWWDKQIVESSYPSYLTFIPKILLGIVISLLDEAYYKVAKWLNDKENYRLETKYENQLIIKVAMFVNSFISFFYIAFYLQDQERLKEQLAVLLMTRQIIGNIKESALPYIVEQFRLAKLSFELFGALSPTQSKEKADDDLNDKKETTTTNNRVLPQAELEGELFKYEGAFMEHLDMFVQLGHVVLFSSAFPMAAFCALLNNLFEIRCNAFKLCFICQRPFGQRVANIGMWQNIMEALGFIAVLVNCALIALSGQVHRMFPDMSATQTLLLIVLLEHIMLAIKFLISCAIPDLPDWVATEIAKVEFARREALNRVSIVVQTPVNTPAKTINKSSTGRFSVSPTVSTFGENFESKKDRGEKNGDKETESVVALETFGQPTFSEKEVPLKLETKLTDMLTQLTTSTDDFDHRVTITGQSGWLKKKKLPAAALRRLDTGLDKNFSPFRSTSCIASKESSTDSNISLSSPVPSNVLKNQFKFPDLGNKESTSSDTCSTTEEHTPLTDSKKRRLKSALIKRARSVAVFSLKLKERRAKANLKEIEDENVGGSKNEGNNIMVGGELSCVPLEMLISLDDVNKNLQKQQKATTPKSENR